MENILKSGGALKRAFVSLESGVADILNEALISPLSSPTASGDAQPGADLAPPRMKPDADTIPETFPDLAVGESEAPPASDEAVERVTAHTQNRLAAFATFDESRSAAHRELGHIGEALASVIASHHLSREFLNDCYADIHRANDMEIQNAALSSQSRRFADRLDKLEKQRVRYEALVEMQKRREARLTEEAGALREELNAIKLDAVEARNVLARTEAQQSELHTELAARTSQAERLLRENEMLREKGVNLTLDLENSIKKQAEIRRKHDDLSAIHASDSARFAGMAAKLASAEKEVVRIQKNYDGLAARLAEATEALRAIELEMAEREKRYQAENHALKGENQTLGARLQASIAEHLDAVSEVAALKTRYSNLDAEKHLAEKKYAALCVEVENERKQRGSGSDKSLVEMQQQEAAALRGEIAVLSEKLKRLLPLEKLHEAAKQRAREKAGLPGAFNTGGKNLLRLMPDMPMNKTLGGGM